MSVKIISEGKKIIHTSEMKLGDLAKVVDGPYKDHILLRTYDRVVSLNEPRHTWDLGFNTNEEPPLKPEGLVVEVLPPDTKLEFVSEV